MCKLVKIVNIHLDGSRGIYISWILFSYLNEAVGESFHLGNINEKQIFMTHVLLR
jgi:hypothetical protein